MPVDTGKYWLGKAGKFVKKKKKKWLFDQMIKLCVIYLDFGDCFQQIQIVVVRNGNHAGMGQGKEQADEHSTGIDDVVYE